MSQSSSSTMFVVVDHGGDDLVLNISKTIIRACNFEIYHNVALNSLYILTGNDVTIYFWSAANRIRATAADFTVTKLYWKILENSPASSFKCICTQPSVVYFSIRHNIISYCRLAANHPNVNFCQVFVAIFI